MSLTYTEPYLFLLKYQEQQTLHCGRADLDDRSGNCGSNGAQQMWTVAGRVDGGCGTMATALAAATAHSLGAVAADGGCGVGCGRVHQR